MSESYPNVRKMQEAFAAVRESAHAAPGAPQQEASPKPSKCAVISDCTTPDLCLSVGTCKGYFVMPPSVRSSAVIARPEESGYGDLWPDGDRNRGDLSPEEDPLPRAAATAPAGGVTDERAAFEEKARAKGFPAARTQPGDACYNDSGSEAAWWGWQARAALTTAARAAEPECDKAPAGWHCTRTKGHDGPCAAHPLVGMTKEWCKAFPGSAAYMINTLAQQIDAARAAEPDSKLIESLQSCLDDPMWADHAEITKATLRKTIAALRPKEPQTMAAELTDEAQREGYDDVESYVAALKQSRDTYFAERNSARDAYRRHRDESDSRGRLINVVLGLVDAPPGANVVQAVAAALTTAARAAEPESARLWNALIDLPGARRRIWNHVIDDELKAGHNSIESVLRAASPTPPTGTSQGEGTS